MNSLDNAIAFLPLDVDLLADVFDSLNERGFSDREERVENFPIHYRYRSSSMSDFIESNFDIPPFLLLAMHPVQQHPPGDAPLAIPSPFVPSRPPSFAYPFAEVDALCSARTARICARALRLGAGYANCAHCG